MPNVSGGLGNFGFFHSDGDMVFANAKVINALQEGAIISLERIRKETTKNNMFCQSNLLFSSEFRNELYYFLKNDLMFPNCIGLPIFGNCDIALNLYQFIRNWTQFNIGETVVIGGKSINGILSNLADSFIKGSGISNYIDYYKIENNEMRDWNLEFGGAVFVLHYNIDDM